MRAERVYTEIDVYLDIKIEKWDESDISIHRGIISIYCIDLYRCVILN